MKTNATNNSGYSDQTLGAMLKDYKRDCRLGHCGHHACRRKADKRFAAATKPVSEKTEVDFDPGFDVGATHKDYLRDRRLGHFGLHEETVRSVPVRRSRGIRRNRNTAPLTVILTDDGRLDKQAMRDQRIFGNEPLWA